LQGLREYFGSNCTTISVSTVPPVLFNDTKPYEWLLPPLNEKIRPNNFLDFENYFDIILDD